MNKEYRDYLITKQWELIKSKALERDNNKCVKCGSSRKLHVHHKHYNNIFNEQLDDLITLCKQCHINTHNKIKGIISKRNKKRNHIKPKSKKKKYGDFLDKFKGGKEKRY